MHSSRVVVGIASRTYITFEVDCCIHGPFAVPALSVAAAGGHRTPHGWSCPGKPGEGFQVEDAGGDTERWQCNLVEPEARP